MKPRILVVQNEYDILDFPLSLLFQEILLPHADTEMWDGPTEPAPGDLDAFEGIIIGGSQASANDHTEWVLTQLDLIKKLAEKNVPLLGVCFGHQLIAKAFGADVGRIGHWNKGFTAIEIVKDDLLLAGLQSGFLAPVFHSEEVLNLPDDFETLARTESVATMAFRHRTRPIWGTQFHPEITPSICKAKRRLTSSWLDPNNFANVHASRVIVNFASLAGNLR